MLINKKGLITINVKSYIALNAILVGTAVTISAVQTAKIINEINKIKKSRF